jgi:hypothetical protein
MDRRGAVARAVEIVSKGVYGGELVVIAYVATRDENLLKIGQLCSKRHWLPHSSPSWDLVCETDHGGRCPHHRDIGVVCQLRLMASMRNTKVAPMESHAMPRVDTCP